MRRPLADELPERCFARGDCQRRTDNGQHKQRSAESPPEKASALRLQRCGTCGQIVAHKCRVLPKYFAGNVWLARPREVIGTGQD